jgi:peptidyl-prolyl cis-trans isomerase SurA
LKRIWTAAVVTAAWLASPALVSAQDAGTPVQSEPSDQAAAFLGSDQRDITVLGKSDPAVRKATALVNGDVITDTDLEQRLNLVIAANGGKVADEERERLRLQVLRNLIDERLQIQEAKAKEITVEKKDVDDTFTRVAKNFKRTPDNFDEYLRQRGASATTLRQQIKAELAWNRLLRRKVEPFVNVGDDEVQAVIAQLEKAKGQDEYRVGEIFLGAPAGQDTAQMATAENIVKQVRTGGSFVAYARQFSESASASQGGDMGWMRAAQLPQSERTVLAGLRPGQVSDPVRVAGGIAVVALVDKRQVLVADPENATLSLKQMSLELTGAQATPEGAKAAVAKLESAAHNMGGCGKVEAAAKTVGAEVSTNDALRLKDMPEALRALVGKMRIGEATPPFGSLTDGIRVLVLCGRDDVAAPKPPSFDEVYNQMNDQRVGLAARRYLRDLRRDAVIDYR